jgi:hypothetical protein
VDLSRGNRQQQIGHSHCGCAGGYNVVEYGDARLLEWYSVFKRIG